MEDVYVRLMTRMDEFPLGAPESENLLDLLRMVFDEEQAELAVDLPGYPVEVGEFAAGLGQDRAGVEAVLERMADDGLVLAREKRGSNYYNLLPLLPGIFEMQFMKAETTPEKRRIAELFDTYYHEGWGRTSFASTTPMARVLVIEEEIPRKDQVLPYEKVSAYIKESTSMALTNCFCRHEAELLGRACGAPKDVCMVLGPFADFLVERGFAWRATPEEMLAALDRAEQAGLVHITDNIQDKINFICNCCGCCCGFLGTLTKLNMSGTIAATRFAASVDGELCNGCEDCLEVCQVSAIAVDDGTACVDGARCIGCGLCVSRCPSSAIAVGERNGWMEPVETIAELGLSILKERGKL
jgi:Na+-translocating ferredoxin:NAD+ oxidoreductase subunit B